VTTTARHPSRKVTGRRLVGPVEREAVEPDAVDRDAAEHHGHVRA
jgi:hypothetical protein